MLRLKKFYTPYWKSILLVLVLVILVAWSNLALPDYLSQIVNTGIQQQGIDTALPAALTESSMDDLAAFQSAEDNAFILSHYHLVEVGSSEAVTYINEYPALKTESIYVLGEVDQDTQSNLESAFSQPLVFLQALRMIQSDPEAATRMLGDNFPIDPSQVPQGDLIAFFKQLPDAQRTILLEQVNQHLSKLEGTILRQVTVSAISQEYQLLGVDMQKVQNNYILCIGFEMILVSIVAVITSLSVSFLASKTSAGIARDVRSAVFKKVESFSSSEFESFSTASLITRTTNDVVQVQIVVFMLIRLGLQAPMIGGLGIMHALNKSPNMWWTIALAVALLIIFILTMFAIVVPKFKLIQAMIDRLNLVMRENLSGMMVVRAFNKQAHEEQRFDDANKDVTNNMLFIGRSMASLFPIMNLIMIGSQIFIIWIGAREVASSSIAVGDLMAFMQYTMQILFSFMNLSMLFIFLPRGSVSADRIADVLETPLAIHDPAEPKQLQEPVRGLVEFHDVDFAYPGAEEDVLHDISFKAEPGQVTSIIGSTGCGKSTLVNLIPRFYEVSKGSITIDGVDVRDINQSHLRDQIGYTPQRGMLFSGTVATNLQVAKPEATEEDMEEAIRIAQAADFVLEDAEGLNLPISQAGTNVSGGQKQRLSIARSLIKKPPVYIFDDSFSALDFKTDAALRKALAKQVSNSTVLIVTQRVATAKNSDQILVLENGRLVGRGTHQDLMEKCQTYQEIASSQLSAEELA